MNRKKHFIKLDLFSGFPFSTNPAVQFKATNLPQLHIYNV